MKKLLTLLLLFNIAKAQICKDSLYIKPNQGNKIVIADRFGNIYQNWEENRCYTMNFMPVAKGETFLTSSIYSKETGDSIVYINKYIFNDNLALINLGGTIVNGKEDTKYNIILNLLPLSTHVFFSKPYVNITYTDYENSLKSLEDFIKLMNIIYPNF